MLGHGHGKEWQGLALVFSGNQEEDSVTQCCDLESECASVPFSFRRNSNACNHFSSSTAGELPTVGSKTPRPVSMAKHRHQRKCDLNAGKQMLPLSSGTNAITNTNKCANPNCICNRKSNSTLMAIRHEGRPRRLQEIVRERRRAPK